MNRAIWLTLLGVAAFAVILIARLPASWVISAPRSGIACADVEGTIWNGTCSGMSSHGQAIGDLTWEIHPARLLAGKLNAAVALTRPSGSARGTVEVGLNRELTARDVRLDAPLDPELMPQVPANLHGTLHAELSLVRVAGKTIKTLEGHIEARNIEQGTGSTAEPFGSYSLTFPATGGEPVGQVRDLGGPLEVQGTLRLTPEPGFVLESLVKPRANAPAELVRDIQYLGSPDAQGRRPFSIGATF